MGTSTDDSCQEWPRRSHAACISRIFELLSSNSKVTCNKYKLLTTKGTSSIATVEFGHFDSPRAEDHRQALQTCVRTIAHEVARPGTRYPRGHSLKDLVLGALALGSRVETSSSGSEQESRNLWASNVKFTSTKNQVLINSKSNESIKSLQPQHCKKELDMKMGPMMSKKPNVWAISSQRKSRTQAKYSPKQKRTRQIIWQQSQINEPRKMSNSWTGVSYSQSIHKEGNTASTTITNKTGEESMESLKQGLDSPSEAINIHDSSMGPWVLRKLPPHLLNRDPLVLPVQKVKVRGKQCALEVNILWNGGLTMNSMSQCWAKATGWPRWSIWGKYGVAVSR